MPHTRAVRYERASHGPAHPRGTATSFETAPLGPESSLNTGSFLEPQEAGSEHSNGSPRTTRRYGSETSQAAPLPPLAAQLGRPANRALGRQARSTRSTRQSGQ